jgi:photosystem II stability/assembly factor-like uncharacterized protein
MKYFTLLIIIFVSATSYSQWQSQNSGTSENLNDLAILYPSHAVIVVGNNGTILKTTDYGLNWVAKNSGTTNNLNAVSFCYEQYGIAVGDHIISLTTDGGESWSVTVINQNAINVSYVLSVYYGFNILIGCDDGTLFFSSDAGNTWNDTVHTNQPVIATGMVWFFPLGDERAFSVTNLYIANTRIPIYPFSDWKLYNNPINIGDSLSCGELNSDYQYIIGTSGNPVSNLLLLKKFKRDTLWIPQYSSVQGQFIPQDVAIYYDYNLFICGSDGKIFTSVDDGVNWLEQNTGVNNKLNSIVFGYNDSIGYSVGDNGIILFTSNGGGINKVEGEPSPIGYYLSQNYPNPFNPSTKINFRIEEFGFVTLKVYDVLGNEVSTLVNEEKPAGKYEVEFNTVKLTSGVYFYQLKTGDYTETKKMVHAK